MSARFGQNLRALRQRAGVTQRALADRLGLSGPSTVSHWESGATLPTPGTVATLAAALRGTPAELLDGVVTPYDALRGARERPAAGLLLSDDETALVTAYRALSPDWQTVLRETILPVFADATRYHRRPPRRR